MDSRRVHCNCFQVCNRHSRFGSVDETGDFAVLCNGTLGFKWTYGIQGPRFLWEENLALTPPHGTQDDYRFHGVCWNDLLVERDDIFFGCTQGRHIDYIGTRGGLVVTDPLGPSLKELRGELTHLDMDFVAHSATEHFMSSGFWSIPRASSPTWHPSPAGVRIYALAGTTV